MYDPESAFYTQNHCKDHLWSFVSTHWKDMCPKFENIAFAQKVFEFQVMSVFLYLIHHSSLSPRIYFKNIRQFVNNIHIKGVDEFWTLAIFEQLKNSCKTEKEFIEWANLTGKNDMKPFGLAPIEHSPLDYELTVFMNGVNTVTRTKIQEIFESKFYSVRVLENKIKTYKSKIQSLDEQKESLLDLLQKAEMEMENQKKYENNEIIDI